MSDPIKLPDSIGEMVHEAYQDIGKPPAQEMGNAFATVAGLMNTVLTPVKLLNSVAKIKADKFISDYYQKVNSIPEEKRVEPNLAVAGPIVEHLKYKITEDTLRSRYLELLSAASNSDNLCKPLIAFDNVLNQLTPVEIKLLNKLFIPLIKQPYPLAELRVYSQIGYKPLYKNLSDIRFENLDDTQISTIISNFERLGIIAIYSTEYVEPKEKRYAYVKNSVPYKLLENQLTNGERLDFNAGSFSTTSFGQSFIETVFAQ